MQSKMRTLSTISPNHIACSHILFDLNPTLGFDEVRNNVIVVLLEDLHLGRILYFTSIMPNVFFNDPLRTALSEQKRVKLQT